MATFRTKSASRKVTEEEYAKFEALAGEQTISEWARGVLSRAGRPHTCEQSILAGVLALRMILLNLFFKLANAVPITADPCAPQTTCAPATPASALALELPPPPATAKLCSGSACRTLKTRLAIAL